MFVDVQPVSLMSRRLCLPRVRDAEQDSVEMVSSVQHSPSDANRDSVRSGVSTPPIATDEKDTKLLLRTSLASRVDLAREQSPPKNTGAEPRLGQETTARNLRSTVSNIEENGSSRPEFPRAVVEPSRQEVGDEVRASNIILFGEAGVGKSSVINLVAGQKRAHISNDALGCTFQYQRHVITLDGKRFAFWDTTGLDEGSEGTVPAKLAESNLRELIRGLARSGGIHLVIYCIRGTRLTKALKHNYDLFYSTICRKKVPVALVVTGLEHQPGAMETWWDENRTTLQRYGLWFHAHACVTTLDVDDAAIRARRSDSQRHLRDLIAEYAGRRAWKIEASLISWATLRNVLRGVSSTVKKTVRRVIIYDGASACRTYRRALGERQLMYELVYVDDPRKGFISGKPAGLLVFYTSSSVARVSHEDADKLKTFHDAADGRACPVIVVLRGCDGDRVAQTRWDGVPSDVRACPVADDPAKIDDMIEKLCVELVEWKPSLLHRAYEAILELLTAMARWQDVLVT